MGAETSTSHLVFFIAATTIAVVAAGIMSATVDDLSQKIATRGAEAGERVATDFRIANDPAEIPNNPVIVYVKNTGSTTIATSMVNVLIDGQVRTATKEVVDQGATTDWRPGDLLKLTIAGLNLGGGDHTIRVITDNGVTDDLKVRI